MLAEHDEGWKITVSTETSVKRARMFTPIGEACVDRLIMQFDMLQTFDDERCYRNANSCQTFSRSASNSGPSYVVCVWILNGLNASKTVIMKRRCGGRIRMFIVANTWSESVSSSNFVTCPLISVSLLFRSHFGLPDGPLWEKRVYRKIL